jgi:hypothetical protein
MASPDEARAADQREVRRLLLDHAIRCFDAEVAVEERIAKRRNLVLTTILAAIGLGILRIGWLDDAGQVDDRHVSLRLFELLLFGAVLCFGRALLVLLALPQGPRSGADRNGLRLAPDLDSLVEPPNLRTAWESVFGATYSAFIRLQESNAVERAALDRAQKSLVAAILLLFLATLGSHFASLWA